MSSPCSRNWRTANAAGAEWEKRGGTKWHWQCMQRPNQKGLSEPDEKVAFYLNATGSCWGVLNRGLPWPESHDYGTLALAAVWEWLRQDRNGIRRLVHFETCGSSFLKEIMWGGKSCDGEKRYDLHTSQMAKSTGLSAGWYR